MSDYLNLTIRKKTLPQKLTTHHNLDEKFGELEEGTIL